MVTIYTWLNTAMFISLVGKIDAATIQVQALFTYILKSIVALMYVSVATIFKVRHLTK